MFSRLANHDRKTLIRHIILFGGGSVALFFLFLFLILPLFIRLLAFRNIGSKITLEENLTLSTRPTLQAPYAATSSALITLSGSGQPAQKIILLVAGIAGPETVVSTDGTFSFPDVPLSAGENTFSAVSENSKGERSNPSPVVSISSISDAPKVEVTTPTQNMVFTKRKENPIQVKGKTESQNQVFLNDRLIFVGSDGSFSGSVALTEGQNTIIVKAVSPAKVETLVELSVQFQP